MSATITRGSTVLTPNAVVGIRSQRDSRNIVHDIIASSVDDITTRPASLRSGTIELSYHSADAEERSAIAELAHAESGVFTLVAADRPSLSFSYVTDQGGRIERELNATTGVWTVRIDYREVNP